jgi:hypothetical protein
MFNSTVLEVGIGLAFVYFLLAVVCSAINETISSFTRHRAKELKKGLESLLGDPQKVRELLDHPLVRGLSRKGNVPSYLPASTFSVAFLDLASSKQTIEEAARALRQTLDDLPPGQFKKAVEVHLRRAGGDLRLLRQNLEQWFDQAMDRVSGWYKRRAQLVILLIATALVGGLNIDSIAIGRAMARNDSLRASLVAVAEGAVKNKEQATPETVTALKSGLEEMGVPIGWSEGFAAEVTSGRPGGAKLMGLSAILVKVAGLLITLFAVALGAPFWFDLLSKIVALRSTGKTAPRSEERPAGESPAPAAAGGTTETP